MYRIFIVEDDETIAKMVAKHLLQHKMYILKQVELLLVKYLVI